MTTRCLIGVVVGASRLVSDGDDAWAATLAGPTSPMQAARDAVTRVRMGTSGGWGPADRVPVTQSDGGIARAVRPIENRCSPSAPAQPVAAAPVALASSARVLMSAICSGVKTPLTPEIAASLVRCLGLSR